MVVMAMVKTDISFSIEVAGTLYPLGRWDWRHDRNAGVSMVGDLLDAIRDELANFAVGLVYRVEGAGSKVRGSGVLVSIEGRPGILTCGHVAEKYENFVKSDWRAS
jgi:hypothetical protein